MIGIITLKVQEDRIGEIWVQHKAYRVWSLSALKKVEVLMQFDVSMLCASTKCHFPKAADPVQGIAYTPAVWVTLNVFVKYVRASV